MKAAYTKTSQNLHLLVNGNTSLPSDLWIPSGAKIKPRVATQYSAGLAYIAGDGNISISGDVYYKSYSNNIILRDFPDFIQNEHIETELLQGIGRSVVQNWRWKSNKETSPATWHLLMHGHFRKTFKCRK
ncbi:MAG: hypothetical protein IPN89_13420 [Saprospiraceae bacterium]|nr:hypothetical protein [Saprospiraceae bacterium]